jgi:two-component system, OmpR family, sensor histidine kinase VicK
MTSRQALRALIVEDSVDDADLIAREIRKGGFNPFTFERIETAVDMAKMLESQKWDIIISDHTMPSLSSLQALAILKNKNLDIPFIIVSGTIGEETAVEAMKNGASDYVMKNNLPRLVPAINRELKEAKTRTDKKHAESERDHLFEKLKYISIQAQERATELEVILNTIIDSVFVTNQSGKITLVNRAGLAMLSPIDISKSPLSLSDLSNLLQIRNPDGRTTTLEELPLKRALKGEDHIEIDEIIYATNKKHDLFVRTGAAPIRDQQGKIVGAVQVIRDVTDLVEFDHLKDQFIRIAAHELKTPLAIIKGYAQLLLKSHSQELSAKSQGLLCSIDQGTERLERIVQNLLDLSQLQLRQLFLSVEELNLQKLAQEVVNQIKLTAAKHRIRLTTAQPGIFILGDYNRIRQVLMTLLNNAIRFSPEGREIQLDVTRQSDVAQVSVKDQGIGIPQEKQGGIFELFYQAHSSTAHDFGGMGVELYIAREIIVQHGGKIGFKSELGKGSVFWFQIPLMRKKS